LRLGGGQLLFCLRRLRGNIRPIDEQRSFKGVGFDSLLANVLGYEDTVLEGTHSIPMVAAAGWKVVMLSRGGYFAVGFSVGCVCRLLNHGAALTYLGNNAQMRCNLHCILSAYEGMIHRVLGFLL
jgi:hypothetical protein